MKWQLSLAGIGIVALAVSLGTIDHYNVGVFHDDAMYVVLARALATGQGYRWINLPDAPVASHFPPGFPLVLAALWKLNPHFPANVVLFKAFNAVCVAGSALLIAQLSKERLDSTRWGLAVGLAAAVSVPTLVLSTMVLSEPLFLVIALLALIAGERLVRAERSVGHAMAIGVLIGAAMLVRAHGIVLLGALLLVLALHRRWRDAGAVAAGFLLVFAPWQLWAALHPAELAAPLAGNYGSYTGWWLRGLHDMGLPMIPATVRRTVLESAAMLVTLMTPARAEWARVLTLVAMCCAFVAGGITLARRSPVTGFFLLLYTGIVIVWPFPPSRFFWGVWPLVVLLVASALWSAAGHATWAAHLRLATGIAAGWLLTGYAEYEVRAARGRWWSSIARAESPRIEAGARWAMARTSPEDIVAADDEGAIFLYTNRRSVPVASFTTGQYLTERPASTEAAEGLVPLIARYPVRVVIVGSRKSFEAARFLASKAVPVLVPWEEFPGGATFTVQNR